MRIAPIRLGTRASRLALVQATIVADALRASGERVEIVEITTSGDLRPRDTAWTEGAFVDALEAALRAGSIDVAVHSAKDLPIPGAADTDLIVAAYPERSDPRDALVTLDSRGTLVDLPVGAVIGTDSPRRTGFIRGARADLRVVPLHGNVETRIRRLDDGAVDGLILAAAGLIRLGLSDRIAVYLDPALVPPAPGQGALAVQVRARDGRVLAAVGAIDDDAVRKAVETERAVLAAVGGGCRSAVGALATIDDGDVRLIAGAPTPGGAMIHRRMARVDANDETWRELGASLRIGPSGDPPRRVLVTRATRQAAEIIEALQAHGIAGSAVPTIAIEPVAPGGALDVAARHLASYAWVVVTSPNGARAILSAAERVFTPLEAPRWAAIGDATRLALAAEGIEVAHQPSAATADALGADLPLRPGDRVLRIRGDRADPSLTDALHARGVNVDDVVAYATTLAPPASRPLLEAALSDPIDAVLFTSGSTVRGLVRLVSELPAAKASSVMAIPAICFGRGAAREATEAGFEVLFEAGATDPRAMAERVATVLGPGLLARRS